MADKAMSETKFVSVICMACGCRKDFPEPITEAELGALPVTQCSECGIDSDSGISAS